MDRATADIYLNRIDTLLRERYRSRRGSLLERLRMRGTHIPARGVEKLLGIAVVLNAIRRGEQAPVQPGFARRCEEAIAEVRASSGAAPRLRSYAAGGMHAVTAAIGLFLVLWLGLRGDLLWAPALLIWLVYTYRLVAGKMLPSVRAKGSPMGGIMDARSKRFLKVALTVLFLVGAVLLGATFGVGGVFVALVALLIGVIYLRGKAPPPQETPDYNPASGSSMMPGRLLDVRGNLYGTRRDD